MTDLVFTQAWWTADGPLDDPYSFDLANLRVGRQYILGLATLIVPGHGAPFRPTLAIAR